MMLRNLLPVYFPIYFIVPLVVITCAAQNNKHIAAALIEQKPEQSKTSPLTDERVSAMLRSLSPYLIEWFIDVNEDIDLNQIWRLLKINVSGDAPSRCSDCSAETFEINLNVEQGNVIALRIASASDGFYQYLIFRRTQPDRAEGWRFLGSFDSRGQRRGPPAHRIESGDGRTWLVIRESSGEPASIKAYGEVWYEIKGEEVKRVLSYPVEGAGAPCAGRPSRSFKSILSRHELDNGVYTVPVQLLISYNTGDCDNRNQSLVLFAKAQKAYYVWSDEKQRFVLDEARSDVTEKEMSEVYSSEKLNSDRFIEYNFGELSKLAESGSSEQKNWLRAFLTTVKDSPQKLALKQALAP